MKRNEDSLEASGTTVNTPTFELQGFPCVEVKKILPLNAGDARDASLTPELGRFSGVENDKPLQYSCLENSMNRGVWGDTVQRVRRD